MPSAFERVAQRIDGYRNLVIELQRKLTAVPALDPSNGGDGEGKKAELLIELLSQMGITEIEVLKAADPRVSAGYRPNILARIPGADRSRTLWVMSHIDVVPAGELADWQSDPWTVRVEGNRLYGRGVEDDQQGIVASLCLAQALHDEKLKPPFDLGLLFVADEETGNSLGIGYVLEHHPIFGPNDLIVVPDGGLADGSMIEVAEKGSIWLRCRVKGKSTHASTPDYGVNAHQAAAHLIVRLEQLAERFPLRNEVFDPPSSTFAVTKVEFGVPNINTIPGEHTFYLDSRVMPNYPLDEVLAAVQALAAENDRARGTTTEVTVVQRGDAAPPTPNDAPIVGALRRAVKAVYGVEARPMGIGGGTVAAHIRRKGISAAVWARMDESLHSPNEYCVLDNVLGDAKVFAHVLLA